MRTTGLTPEHIHVLQNAKPEVVAQALILDSIKDFTKEQFDLYFYVRNIVLNLILLVNDEIITEERCDEIEKELSKQLKEVMNVALNRTVGGKQ